MPSCGVFRFIGLMAVLATTAPTLLAQEPADVVVPAHVQYVDGSATLERDGQVEPVTLNMPLVPGDRLHTSSGRVEIFFADASALDIDQDSTVDLLSPMLVRLTFGRVMLTVTGAADPSRAIRYQIDAPTATVQTDGPGEFRVSALRGDETELSVMRGYAVLTNDRGSLDLRAGERSVAFDNAAPSRTQVFNSARFDAFDRFVGQRRDARLTASSSSRYLPRELQVYGGALDSAGTWQYDASYGNVWYPSVAADWRPYYEGYWSSVPSYGWTWIGSDVWAWPTHHYGRWGRVRDSWFWIPGRAFAPAWVSWASAADYVSWCPLGFDNRAVFSFSVGAGSWLGWTVVPRTSFGFREHRVNRYAVAGDRLPRSAAFVTHAAPPAARGGIRTNAAIDPRASFRRRDDGFEGARGPRGVASGISGAENSRRRDLNGAARPGVSPNVGAPGSTEAARRRDAINPPRVREHDELARRTTPGGDVFSSRRGDDRGVQPGVARPNVQAPARPEVQDLTRRSPGMERGFRQPLPDTYRRPTLDNSARPADSSRSDASRFQTAIPRYRPPAAPVAESDRQSAGSAGRRAAPAPSSPPGVIYYRGPEQPPAQTPPSVRRTPEPAAPAGAPAYHRGSEGPPPRQMPSAPAASDRPRGQDRGSDRGAPRQDGSGHINSWGARRR